jgi:hypothetical protein
MWKKLKKTSCPIKKALESQNSRLDPPLLLTSSDCFLLAPISRLFGFPKCGRATDIVSSSADASCLKKQNFMSDKKRTTFFHCFFVLVLKKPIEKKIPFFYPTNNY